jgi:hypothetical protein
MLKTIVYSLIVFSLLRNAQASDSWVIVDTVQKSHCLCGQVRLYGGGDEGGEGFLVEELTPDFNQVIRSTHAGKKGYFEFPKTSSREIHYICISGDLWQTTCRKVQVSKKVQEKLLIIMSFK